MFYIVFELQRIVHISATRYLIGMGFGSKCSILNRKVIYIEKSKLNFADIWLVPLHWFPASLVSHQASHWSKMQVQAKQSQYFIG